MYLLFVVLLWPFCMAVILLVLLLLALVSVPLPCFFLSLSLSRAKHFIKKNWLYSPLSWFILWWGVLGGWVGCVKLYSN